MDCANLNGYNTVTTGCQIIIGDGLRGTDEVEVPVKNGEYVEKAKIGRASWMPTFSSAWLTSRAMK